MLVVPSNVKAIASMLGSRSPSDNADVLVKKLHRYSHDNARDMRRLLKMAGQYNARTEAAIKKVINNCETCVRSGVPRPSRKVSIKHVDKDFNQVVVVDFFYFQHGAKPATFVLPPRTLRRNRILGSSTC